MVDQTIVDAPHDTGCTSQNTADDESLTDTVIHIDAHQCGSCFFQRNRAHGTAQFGALYDIDTGRSGEG